MQKTDKTCIQIIAENDEITVNIKGSAVEIISLLVHTYEKIPDFEKMVITALDFKEVMKKEYSNTRLLESFGDKAQA